MALRLTDADIARLVIERQPVEANWLSRLKPRPKRGHSEVQVDLNGEAGSDFRVMVRQSLYNPLDFSVILAYRPPNSNALFRLRRHNGRSHEHSNTIENVRFYDFHIHMATERYQDVGEREDFFAEPTSRYADLDGAIGCLMADCNIQRKAPEPLALFARRVDG